MQTYMDKSLTIQRQLHDGALRLRWTGRSNERDPSKFLSPLLREQLKEARQAARPLHLDFTELEYMNSSTFTPLVKLLEEARQSGARVTIIYRRGIKWQELSFSALRVFETPDKRIELRGEA